MKMDLVRPCEKCPFSTGCLKGWLGRSRAQEIADALLSDQSFACHETVEHDDDGEQIIGSDKEQHCAGALILLEKLEQPNQWMRWMERIGFYNHQKLDMDASVFDEPEAFIEHHARPARRRTMKGR